MTTGGSEPTFPDFSPAPNQGGRPDLYELENRAIDPDGVLLEAMRKLAPWAGRTLVDLGCGSGYWLPGYAEEAGLVIGVEPDPALLPLAEGTRLFCSGVDPGEARRYGTVVDVPSEADVALVRLATPFEPRDDGGIERFFHAGSLDFAEDTIRDLAQLSGAAPATVVMSHANGSFGATRVAI